jgi:hypothetical protein
MLRGLFAETQGGVSDGMVLRPAAGMAALPIPELPCSAKAEHPVFSGPGGYWISRLRG